MPTLSQVRTALVATVNAGVADPLYAYDTVADVVELPAVLALPLQNSYMVSAGFTEEYEIYLYVMCQRNDTQVGQGQLDAYIANSGPDSIPRAVNGSPTLGLANCDATVYAMHGYGGSFVVAGIPHVGAILKVKVVFDP